MFYNLEAWLETPEIGFLLTLSFPSDITKSEQDSWMRSWGLNTPLHIIMVFSNLLLQTLQHFLLLESVFFSSHDKSRRVADQFC